MVHNTVIYRADMGYKRESDKLCEDKSPAELSVVIEGDMALLVYRAWDGERYIIGARQNIQNKRSELIEKAVELKANGASILDIIAVEGGLLYYSPF